MDEAKEIDYVFNVVHHASPNRVTPYLVVTPDTQPSLSPALQVAHVRGLHGNTAYNMAGDREFTVAWTLVPLVEEPNRFLGDLDGEPSEPLTPNTNDFSERAVGVVYGVAVYNENDAKTGVFFNKREGRRLAVERLDDYLLKMQMSDNQDMTSRLADLSVLELSSKACSILPSGYLELPRVGRFLYDEVRQFVLNHAGTLVSQTLDDDFDFAFYNRDQEEPSDMDTPTRVYTVTAIGEDDSDVTPEDLAAELSDSEFDELVEELAPGASVMASPYQSRTDGGTTSEEAKANTGGCGNCANCECNGESQKA